MCVDNYAIQVVGRRPHGHMLCIFIKKTIASPFPLPQTLI